MSGDNSEPLESQLTTCYICSNKFSDPRLLACLDTFCYKCLENLHKSQTDKAAIVCPLCHSKTNFPSEGLPALSANGFVSTLIQIAEINEEQKAKKAACSACLRQSEDAKKPPAAVVYCAECEDKLCSACSDAHRKLRITESHKLVDLNEKFIANLTDARRNKPTSCSEHSNQPCSLYCRSSECQTPICLMCAVLTHKMHDYTDIAEVATFVRKELHEVVECLQGKLKTLRDYSEILKNHKKSVAQNTKIAEDALSDRTREIQAVMEERQKTLLQTARTKAELELRKFNDTEATLMNKRESLYWKLLFCQKLAEGGNGEDICLLSNNLSNTSVWLCNDTEDVLPDRPEIGISSRQKNLSLLDKNASVLFGSLSTEHVPVPHEKSASAEAAASNVLATGEVNTKANTYSDNITASASIQSCLVAPVDAAQQQANISRKSCTEKPVNVKPTAIMPSAGKVRIAYCKTPRLIGKIAGKEPVRGIAVIDDQLFVVRRRPSSITVYNAESLVACGSLEVAGLTDPTDMAACTITKQLYISNVSGGKVLRVKVCTKTVKSLNTKMSPYGISITPRTNVIVAHQKNACFSEFTREWIQVRLVKTPGYQPFHVAALSEDRVAMCSGPSKGNSSVVIAIVQTDPTNVSSTLLERSSLQSTLSFKQPTHIVIDKDQNIFVVDSHHNRVVMVDQQLSKVRWELANNAIVGLYKMHLDTDKKSKLFIGIINCIKGAGVLAYDVST